MDYGWRRTKDTMTVVRLSTDRLSWNWGTLVFGIHMYKLQGEHQTKGPRVINLLPTVFIHTKTM